MINTTGTTFLRLTLGCARCHNHKFDPVTQVDYYSLQAIFSGVKHGDRTLPPSKDQQAKIAALGEEIANLTCDLERFIPKASDGKTTIRPAVNAKHNVEMFDPVEAKLIRFVIANTNRGQPCLDELEIFSGGKIIALASAGAKATASASLKGYEIHNLVHINDGKYGNGRSWICDQTQGWVQIELAEATLVDRIEWARDREGRYADRLAIDYRIKAGVDADELQLVASSRERQTFNGAEPKPPS